MAETIAINRSSRQAPHSNKLVLTLLHLLNSSILPTTLSASAVFYGHGEGNISLVH